MTDDGGLKMEDRGRKMKNAAVYSSTRKLSSMLLYETFEGHIEDDGCTLVNV